MKKLLFFACVLTFGFYSQAQEIKIGAKAGANFASITGDGADGTDGRTSLHVGAVGNFGISELFAIQPEIIYSAQGFQSDLGGGVDATFKLDYLNIPIMADFQIAEGLSLQGGPQFGFNVTSEAEADGETADIEDVESVDIGAGIGAQFELPLGLFFQARYTIGFNDIVEDADSKNSVINVSVGYFFN